MNPLVLIILDGFGSRDSRVGNATLLAQTPTLDRFFSGFPHTQLDASGEAVGLPAGVMGNSEVGHLTIGSGRIFYQDLTRINKSLQDGSFYKNEILSKAFKTVKKGGKTLHLMGLLSDAGVHSHLPHLVALLKMAKDQGIERVSVHCFTDGRDTPPDSGIDYVRILQQEMKALGVGQIATIVGRYYAMDRDQRWERVQIAYEALVEGKGRHLHDPIEGMRDSYRNKETDEFIKPLLFEGGSRIGEGDGVIFFNFRPDRAREITQALTDPAFSGFKRKRIPTLCTYLCMTQYDKSFDLPVAFPPDKPTRVLAEILGEKKIPQFHTAETEKYPHVTYFLNGGVEKPFPMEERILIPSPRDVPTYDKKPEMSAFKVTETALKKIKAGLPVVIVNFANPDMVGHSGNLKATIQAIEVIDQCLHKLASEITARQGTLIVTSDHGNCEQMEDKEGAPHTAHTTNRVPFALVGDRWRGIQLHSDCGLKDIAPTLLQILGITPPPEMTGKSLIIPS